MYRGKPTTLRLGRPDRGHLRREGSGSGNAKPEYTDNYELSVRSAWLDDKLTVNANLFYLDWQDQQLSVQLTPNDLDMQTVNIGTSTVQGAELEVSYALTHSITTYVALGISDTEFNDFIIDIPTRSGVNTVIDLSGRPFSAPKYTHNLGLMYQGDSGLFADINASYSNAYPTTYGASSATPPTPAASCRRRAGRSAAPARSCRRPRLPTACPRP